MPTNICQRCLYTTESYSEFRDSVHRCERRLHSFVESLPGFSTNSTNFEPIQYEPSRPCEPNIIEQREVVVIDPTKCYDSSDEDEADDNGIDGHNSSNDQINYELIAAMYNKLSLPENTQQSNTVNDTKKFNVDNSDTLRNLFFCKYCEAAFNQRSQCEAHETNNHDPVTPYACNFCPFRCDNRSDVIAHIKQIHGLDKPYVCVQCNKSFGRRANLKKHCVCHANVRPFQCQICGKAFSRKTNVTKHMKIHAGNKKYSCQQCNTTYGSNADLQRHEKTHSEVSKPLHQCSLCLANFISYETLVQHQRCHTNDMIFAGNSFEQQQQPQQQQPNINPYLNVSPAVNNQFVETKKENESKHAAKPQVLDSVVYSKCTISTDSNSMQIPKLRLTKKIQKRYGCDNCSKTFATMSTLKNHKKIHVNTDSQQSFWCSICSKSFKMRREFDRHNLIHTGVKNFQCSVCQKKFLRRDKLVRHEKIHAAKRLTAALPESAFSVENLKRGSHLHSSPLKNKNVKPPPPPPTSSQQYEQEVFRPQFYAEYDLSESQT